MICRSVYLWNMHKLDQVGIAAPHRPVLCSDSTSRSHSVTKLCVVYSACKANGSALYIGGGLPIYAKIHF